MRTVSLTKKNSISSEDLPFGVSTGDIERISSRLGEGENTRDLRMHAWNALQNIPRPTRRDEAWRRTDPGKFPFGKVSIGGAEEWSLDAERTQLLKSDLAGGWLVNHPGHQTDSWLKPALVKAGVIFADWQTAVSSHAEFLEEYLNSVVTVEDHWFAALSASMAESGGLIYVPEGLEVDLPLKSVFWAPGAGKAFFSRYLIVVDEGASLNLDHEYASPTEAHGSAFHAGIFEVIVRRGGHLKLSILQNWGEHVWDVVHKRVQLAQDASVEWNAAVFGGQTSKDFSDLDLVGEGASGRWAGLFFGQDHQHFDIDTQQNHYSPHTTSDLLFNGALVGQSRSVWQGMILVEKEAQQTDGYQANRNLLLSHHARADSIPGLEIKADDVRCTHGATVGQVDKEQVYYLMSRGITRSEAERLVVQGFFTPVLDRITDSPLRDRLNHIIDDKMGQYRVEQLERDSPKS